MACAVSIAQDQCFTLIAPVYQRSVVICSVPIDVSLLKPIVAKAMEAILQYDASL